MDAHVLHKYLLLDSRTIEQSENARFAIGSVEKEPTNPLFVEDKPWEVRFDNLYANVIYDEEAQIYKCWYNPFIVDEATTSTPPAQQAQSPYCPRGVREMAICYAESSDGIAWEKPDLGIVEFGGSRHNNLVMRQIHGAGVYMDRRDPDPARRYKAFMKEGVATSPDGLHWSAVQACPEIQARGDTHNFAFWSESQGMYVGLTRLWQEGERIVGRTHSNDYRQWTQAVEIMRALPSEPDRQTYALLAFPYANVYLGLVMLLDMTEADTVDCELAWSPDTIQWQRICPGTPLIPRGPAGSFDSGCIYAAATPVNRPGGLQLYYGGNDGPHMGWRRGGLGLARLRPDGFAGMEPTVHTKPATIITSLVECTGSQIRVSADAAGGRLRVAVLGQEDFTLEQCCSLSANVTDEPISWGHGRDLSPFAGKPIRLRFELEDAKLYAFQFDNSNLVSRPSG